MRAAVVRVQGEPPVYGEFDDPVVGPGETLVTVRAAAVSPLVLSRAAGAHYSSRANGPFVPGIDGVGTTPEGRRVYFAFPRPPFGSLAERVPVRTTELVELPAGLEDATAAAAANPGMSCWIPLRRFARVRPDEAVLVNGATGAAGHAAVQVAKYLGAGRVIATGRSEAELATLRALGADTLLPIGASLEAFRTSVRTLAREARLGTVLDYLWGPTAEAILAALGGPEAPRGSDRVRFIHVGGLAGPTVTLDGSILRSSGVELLGSGLGSSTFEELRTGIGEFLRAFDEGHFQLETEVHPLSEAARAWGRTGGARRVVFRVP
jgi:NADPH:quinone reductase-like Zn-dependent oxidoreductase